jgi:hypothetical protein
MKICSDFFSVIGAYVNLHIFSSAISKTAPICFLFPMIPSRYNRKRKGKKSSRYLSLVPYTNHPPHCYVHLVLSSNPKARELMKLNIY